MYENDQWSGLIELPIKNGFTEWDAFMQQGRLKLFVKQFSRATLYTVAGSVLADPVRLESPFQPMRMIRGMACFVIGLNGMFFLTLWGVSAILNKFKRRVWAEGEARYEFASLLRRAVAFIIDSLVLLVPPACAAALIFPFNDFSRNPLGPILFVFGTAFFIIVGGFLYHSMLEGLLGRTLGKKICGIRVLKADFTACGLGAGFLRNLMRIVDGFFYYLAGVVALAATLKWQRLGDLVAETIVVRERKS